MGRSVRLIVDAKIRRATRLDLAALATWSGQVNQVLRPALDRDERVLLVATANGRFPIGHLLVNPEGVLSNLLVLNGFRDQGLVTQMIAAGEEVLREAGRDGSELVVEKPNEDARRLYERLGYRVEGETSAVWSVPTEDGRMQPVEHPSWVMRKKL